jgi:hypothetical protein
MTYLIKHPINRYTPKFAIAYNSVDYTISAGIGTFTLSLNTLTQSAGMGLSLASNQITLAAKKYMIYYKAGLTNATENRAGDITILLNGAAVSTSQSVQAITTATTSGTSSGVVTPQNLASCLISATAGDVISFRYSRTSGASIADTVNTAMSKAFILEIGDAI